MSDMPQWSDDGHECAIDRLWTGQGNMIGKSNFSELINSVQPNRSCNSLPNINPYSLQGEWESASPGIGVDISAQ